MFGQGVSLNYRVMGEEGADDASSAATTRRCATSGRESRSRTPFTQVAPEGTDSQLNRRYTFDNFFEGVTNKLARTAGVAVSNDPGKTTFNPLFIYAAHRVSARPISATIGLTSARCTPRSASSTFRLTASASSTPTR